MWLKIFAFSLLLAGTQAQLEDLIGGIIQNITQAINNTEGLVAPRFDISDETKLELGYAEDTTLNFIALATKYGYESAEFTVTTEDGYILSLFRLWAGSCTSRGTPVLLTHGFSMSADSYLIAGPGAALGYLLADACYDVWIGNFRGSVYGRRHTTLNPDVDAEFWMHSADEWGQYDAPAIINAVLEETNYNSLNYIGFSEGGTVPLTMCTENAEACARLNVIISLAPPTRLTHTTSVFTRLVLNTYMALEDTFAGLNIFETFYKGGILQTVLEYSCQMQGQSDWLYQVCLSFYGIVDSPLENVSDETQRLLYSNFVVGSSVRILAKWGQALRSNRFQKYDFGSEEANLAAYNSTTPPAYDLSLVNVPVAVIQGAADGMVNPRDSLWAASQLPQLLGYHIIEDPTWNHLSFTTRQDVATYVLPTILQYLSQYTSQ